MPFLTPLEAQALELSLRIGLVAVAGGLPVAFAFAYALARGRFPGRGLLSAVIYLPLVLPPVVTGYVLLLLFGRHGPIGAWFESWFGLVFAFRWTGAALAAAIMAMPLMVRAIQLSLEAVDEGLEQAAAGLGAPGWAVFLTVTLPLSLPGVMAGALMGFAKSLGEFGATITFVSNIPGQTQTLPTAIYTLLQVPGSDPAVIRLALLSVAVSGVAVLTSEIVGRRLKQRAAR
ncbi:MAG TPA: molybdate ABC transporter permease subunit [Aliidongia sp.]|nr:molybdate ABC transporter permease subunit [Aliidongia sp.]